MFIVFLVELRQSLYSSDMTPKLIQFSKSKKMFKWMCFKKWQNRCNKSWLLNRTTLKNTSLSLMTFFFLKYTKRCMVSEQTSYLNVKLNKWLHFSLISVVIFILFNNVKYFNRFLGDQRSSYNQILEFSLRIGDNRPVPTATDIILEGGGTSVTNTIFAQKHNLPSIQVCSNVK